MVFGGERMRISRRHQSTSIGKVYRTLTATLLLMRGKDQKRKLQSLMGEQVNLSRHKPKSLGEILQLTASVCCLLPQHFNFSTTYVCSVKFQMAIRIICCWGFCSQTAPILVISCCFYCKGRLRDVQ